MSWQGGWKEEDPGWKSRQDGKSQTGKNSADAVDQWLLNRLELPEKLWRRLRHDKEIELTGDRLRLALFL